MIFLVRADPLLSFLGAIVDAGQRRCRSSLFSPSLFLPFVAMGTDAL